MGAPPRTARERTPCRLVDAAGELVSGGLCQVLDRDARGTRVRVTALDRPGAVVQRCVLGALTTVVLQLADGEQLTARIERVDFDNREGRTCVLVVPAAAATAPRPPSAPRGGAR